MQTPTRQLKTFTPAQLESFMRDGYTVIREAFPRAVAEAILPMLWEAAPFKKDDRSTWERELNVVPRSLGGPLVEQIYTQRVMGAIEDLLFEGRYQTPGGTGYLVLNLPGFSTPPWRMFNGHVDGNFFHHHLDSREQGLVLLFLYSDLQKEGGGTGIRVGSHAYTARVLAEAEPEGLSCGELLKRVDAATRHLPVIEAIGQAGDMLIMHPFTFHGSSSNLSDVPRMASNMCVGLKEKMVFNRVPGEQSPVEQMIIDALGR